MPTYDYYCKANDQTVEVRHSLQETINTWGELCALAEIDPGEQALDTPVKRLLAGGTLALSKRTTPGRKQRSHGGSGHVCGPGCRH